MATEELGNLKIVEEAPLTTPTEQEPKKEETWSMQPRPSCQICSGNYAEHRPIHEQDAQP